jgi:hypothetical protein
MVYQRRLDKGTLAKIRRLEAQLGDFRILATHQGGFRKEAA